MSTNLTLPSARPPVDGARRLWLEARVGLAIIGVFFGGFGAWASVAPLANAVVAPGAVVVAGARRAVQHREGGIVQAIFVEEGQRVEAGDILIELDDTDLAAQERALKTQIIALTAQRSRLQAERRGEESFGEPVEFVGLQGEERIAADQAMDMQRGRFEARANSIENETDVLRRRVEQLNSQIDGLRSQAHAQQSQIELVQDELEQMRTLNEDGYAPSTRVRALERNVAELEGRRAEYDAATARAEQQIGETELQMTQLVREREESVAGELQEVQQRLSTLTPQHAAVLAQLARTKMRAPATGRVVGLNVHTEDGVVAPGQVLLEIVPEDAALVVRARVNPLDIDGLNAGAEAQIRLTAFSSRQAPVLRGSVSLVSADRMVEESTGVPYYLVEVSIAPEELERIEAIRNGTAELRAGMPAEVVFPLRSRTALQYIVEPLTDRVWRSFHEG